MLPRLERMSGPMAKETVRPGVAVTVLRYTTLPDLSVSVSWREAGSVPVSGTAALMVIACPGARCIAPQENVAGVGVVFCAGMGCKDTIARIKESSSVFFMSFLRNSFLGRRVCARIRKGAKEA